MTTLTQYYVGATKKRKSTSLFLTMKEKRAIINELNLTALYLLEFYLSVITRKGYIINDKKTAAATGLTLRSVQDSRRLLVKNNLYYETVTTNADATIYLYCALKEGVYSIKYFDRLFGCKNMSGIFKKYTRKEIDHILAGACLTTMEIDDINRLLDDFHSNGKP